MNVDSLQSASWPCSLISPVVNSVIFLSLKVILKASRCKNDGMILQYKSSPLSLNFSHSLIP